MTPTKTGQFVTRLKRKEQIDLNRAKN
ncbi:hypothetical protein [Kaistella polysaccharea]|nr:hypothetical protein [Kaistella polysaccharea]